MFATEKLAEDGELPGPFSFEKYGFNYHKITGIFDKDEQGNPTIMTDSKGFMFDKKHRRVNKHGFLMGRKG